MTSVYKIKNNQGLFSAGGNYAYFNKTGKIWKKRTDVLLHLNQLAPHTKEQYIKTEAQLVEYEIDPISAISIETIFKVWNKNS